jgi:hypothetical protein
MSQMGQSRRFDRLPDSSGLPPGTDIVRVGRHVSNVPEDDSASEFKDLTSRVWSCQCRKFANARRIAQYTRIELPTGPAEVPTVSVAAYMPSAGKFYGPSLADCRGQRCSIITKIRR